MVIITTNDHFNTVFGKPDVYLSMIPKTLSGKYLSIIALTSESPILSFIKVNILKKISTIATKKTKDENLLKNMTISISSTANTIKSIYILLLPILLIF